MQFYSQSKEQDVTDCLFEQISAHLKLDERVLWLTSGGSAIRIETAVADKLRSVDCSNLTVSLFDERYGQPGHDDSNWRQLEESGFKLPGAKLQPALTGGDMPTTAKEFSDFMSSALQNADFKIGLAGIGPDGHTLGIKPGSPALDADDLVAAYDWDDYRRITATSKVIEVMDEIVVFAFGAEKKEQLDDLAKDLDSSSQPAQLLKLCRNVRIYSNQRLAGS